MAKSKQTMAQVPDTVPAPTEATKIAIAKAVERKAARPARVVIKTSLADGKSETRPDHSDGQGWGAMLCDAFGTSSHAFTAGALTQLTNALRRSGESGTDDSRSNFALAAMGAIAPADEFEALLATQLVATQALAMDSLMRASVSDNILRRDSYITQATKLSRTFGTLTETLGKHRSGGKQQVEVRYVYVDQRTQTVVNAGGGAAVEEELRTFDRIGGVPLSLGSAVHGHEPFGQSVAGPLKSLGGSNGRG